MRKRAARSQSRAPAQAPSGTLTFLFTDIEGSTAAWIRDPGTMAAALARHDAQIESIATRYDGWVVKPRGEGDSRFVVFARATDAVAAAAAMQVALMHEAWPVDTALRVRMALHTGESDLRAGDYYGPAVNHCARLRAIAHGGQVLVSSVTADLVRESLATDIRLLDLGEHLLKDLTQPEHVWQLLHPELPAEFPGLNSVAPVRPPGALVLSAARTAPRPLTSFVGRASERAEIKHLLASSRLVTLTGFGGVGKTRLALEVASDLVADYADGPYVVELAALRDPALVPRAVASALGVDEQPGVPLATVIAETIADRRLLLIIDNCEHVVSAVARLLDGLLRDCSEVRILATSREVIGVGPELAWSVPPLTLPDRKGQVSVEQMRKSEAVLLFGERCRAVQPGFALTPNNAAAVAEVCWRVDGIPLALELAAARVRVLTIQQLADRLSDQLASLGSPNRIAEPRQQTLRAAIEWSYRLLSDQERLLFDRLSVFAGGFSIESVEAVCTGDGVDAGEVVNLLQSLVEKSLVVADLAADGFVERLRQLESLRQFGHERLAASDAQEALNARHAKFFAAVVDDLGARIHGPDQEQVLTQLDIEHDNIRAALGWLVQTGDADTALRFAGMGWFWTLRGHWTEARGWAERVLALPCKSECDRLRASMLLVAAQAAWLDGDMPTAFRLGQAGLACAREAKDQRSEGFAIGFIGLMLWIRQEHAVARPLFEQSLALVRAAGDGWAESRQLEQLAMAALRDGDLVTARDQIEASVSVSRQAGDTASLSIALNFLGDVAAIQGERDVAEAAYRESLTLSDALGAVPSAIPSLFCLGFLAVSSGDLEQAASLLRESLQRVRRRGGKRGIAECLIGFAGIARTREQYQVATRLLGAAEAAFESIGATTWITYQQYLDREVAIVRARLQKAAFENEWRAGRALPANQAIALAFSVADSLSVRDVGAHSNV